MEVLPSLCLYLQRRSLLPTYALPVLSLPEEGYPSQLKGQISSLECQIPLAVQKTGHRVRGILGWWQDQMLG